MYMKKIIKDESGIALITALLIMTLLMMLGTAAIMTSTTDVKISSNFKTYAAAFYNADAGVATGEDWISTTVGSGAPANFAANGNGYYNYDTGGEVDYSAGKDISTLAWDANDSITVTANNVLYMVEYLGQTTLPAAPGGGLGVGGGGSPPEIRYVYRVTGKGTSGTGTNTVQSIYAVR